MDPLTYPKEDGSVNTPFGQIFLPILDPLTCRLAGFSWYGPQAPFKVIFYKSLCTTFPVYPNLISCPLEMAPQRGKNRDWTPPESEKGACYKQPSF
jgi:hypothetical protein